MKNNFTLSKYWRRLLYMSVYWFGLRKVIAIWVPWPTDCLLR